MKRIKILFLVAILSVMNVCAQSFKVKKGELQIDGTPVAKFEKKDGKFVFSDLSNNLLFRAFLTEETAQGNTAPHRWIEFSNANGVIREVEIPDKVKFTFSGEKYVIDCVYKSGTNLLTEKGIDPAVVTAFFQTSDRPFSEKWDNIFQQEKNTNQTEDNLATADNLSVEGEVIVKNGKKIGFIKRKEESGDGGIVINNFTVTDSKGNVVATAKHHNFNQKDKEFFIIKTYDEKEIPVFSQLTKMNDANKRIVKRLYANGYPFGDMTERFNQFIEDKKNAINEQNNAKVEEAKKQTVNIYDAAGYVIDAKGDKKEGLITIEFQSVDAIIGKDKNMSDLTSYGATVKLKREGEKDLYFKAKDGNKFCIGERCFLGAKGSEDGFFADGCSDLNVLSGAAQFFEILYEKDGNYVLAHSKYPEDYYLKIKKADKAVYLGTKTTFGSKSTEKIQKILSKYVNCSSLDVTKYNTLTKEGMIQLVDDYTSSCK